MNNELVELVVQLYEKNWGVKDYGLARAVVALIRPATLEEAAKVAEEAAANTAYPDDFISGYNGACEDCAAAIRALVNNGKKND